MTVDKKKKKQKQQTGFKIQDLLPDKEIKKLNYLRKPMRPRGK